MPLLLLFVVMPVMEMWLLIEVGGQIGALATIALVLLTAMVGLTLLRKQGFATLMKANRKMAEGQLPAEEMAEGIFLAIGGALLLTPGFVTDSIGFACLLPGVRQWLIGGVVRRMMAKGQFRAYGSSQSGGFQPRGPFTDKSDQGEIIEGDYSRENQRDEPARSKLNPSDDVSPR